MISVALRTLSALGVADLEAVLFGAQGLWVCGDHSNGHVRMCCCGFNLNLQMTSCRGYFCVCCLHICFDEESVRALLILIKLFSSRVLRALYVF